MSRGSSRSMSVCRKYNFGQAAGRVKAANRGFGPCCPNGRRNVPDVAQLGPSAMSAIQAQGTALYRLKLKLTRFRGHPFV